MNFLDIKPLYRDITSIVKSRIEEYIDECYNEDYFETKNDIEEFKNIDYPNDLESEIISEIEDTIKDGIKNETYNFSQVDEEDIDIDRLRDLIEEEWENYKECVLNDVELPDDFSEDYEY